MNFKFVKVIAYILYVGVWIQGISGSFDVGLVGGYPTECRVTEAGMEYGGSLAVTSTGYTCQRWDSQTPHSHSYDDSPQHFPEGNVTAAGNACRNPDPNYPTGVWCYTTSLDKSWELCDVPLCECKFRDDGRDYVGSLEQTSSGKRCMYWDDVDHGYTDEMFMDVSVYDAGRGCRNPNGSREDGPWCFYSSEDGTQWDYCDVAVCNSTLTNFDDDTISDASTVDTHREQPGVTGDPNTPQPDEGPGRLPTEYVVRSRPTGTTNMELHHSTSTRSHHQPSPATSARAGVPTSEPTVGSEESHEGQDMQCEGCLEQGVNKMSIAAVSLAVMALFLVVLLWVRNIMTSGRAKEKSRVGPGEGVSAYGIDVKT